MMFLKHIASKAAYTAIIPTILSYSVASEALGRDLALQTISENASLWTGLWGILKRRALYTSILPKVGKKLTVSFGSLFSRFDIEIGSTVYIGWSCSLGNVCIGNDVMIADHVSIPSGARQHGFLNLDIPMRAQGGEFQKIRVGDDCWIGSGAIVLADVGNHSIIGAGSIVTRPVPDYAIVSGNPARMTGDRRGLSITCPSTKASHLE